MASREAAKGRWFHAKPRSREGEVVSREAAKGRWSHAKPRIREGEVDSREAAKGEVVSREAVEETLLAYVAAPWSKAQLA